MPYQKYRFTATKIKKGEWLYRGYTIKLNHYEGFAPHQNHGGLTYLIAPHTSWKIDGLNKEFQQLGDARIYIDRKERKDQCLLST